MNIKIKILTAFFLVLAFFGFWYGGIYLNKNNNEEISLISNYVNKEKGFSIDYPTNYTLDEKYIYQALGPGKELKGIKFTINSEMTTGTNLGTDSYFGIEELPSSLPCIPASFFDREINHQEINENGVSYIVASSTDAGAGNRYEETIYILKTKENKCMAFRYFIHYGVFENYPSGSVVIFDKQKLIGEFDKIRKSFRSL